MIGTGRLSSGHKRSPAHAVVVGKGCGAIRGPELQAEDAAGHTVDEPDRIKTGDDRRIHVLPQRSRWKSCIIKADAELIVAGGEKDDAARIHFVMLERGYLGEPVDANRRFACRNKADPVDHIDRPAWKCGQQFTDDLLDLPLSHWLRRLSRWCGGRRSRSRGCCGGRLVGRWVRGDLF